MLGTPRIDVSDRCSTLTSVKSLRASGWSARLLIWNCVNWSAEMLSTGPELRLLRLLSCLTLVLLCQVTDAKKDLKSACNTCRQITENFNKVSERLQTSFLCVVFHCVDMNIRQSNVRCLGVLYSVQGPSYFWAQKLKCLRCMSGLRENSKPELWRRKHSLGGEEIV